MLRSLSTTLLALGVACASRAGGAPDLSRRFFDFTPVSAANPVVAVIGGQMQIPLSELRGYRDAERPKSITDPSDLAQKRAVLADLINEYLYVDEACRSGLPESPAFARRMEATRTMILTDFLAAHAIGEKANAATTTAEADNAALALADRLFEAASIEVSNEAYAVLKRAAKTVDALAENAPERAAILDATPEATLVRYDDRSLSVRQILAIYAGLPATKRPPLATEAGLIAMIKPLIAPELMAIEAAKRGIAAEPAFEQKLIQNRNALLRFHVHGAIESRANAALRNPDLEAKLQAFHRAHPELYGKEAFAVVRDRVLGDYSVDLRDRLLAEKAQELRREISVTVDEAVLRAL